MARWSRAVPVLFVLLASPLWSQAASLSLTSVLEFELNGLSVSASDGSVPIGGSAYKPVDGVVAGSMSLDPSALSFSFSIFNDSNPYVVTGSYGASALPVTLRVDEISYVTNAPAQISGGHLTGSVTGTMRGSLSVGANTAPFTLHSQGDWYSDGAQTGTLDAYVTPNRVLLGYSEFGQYNGGIRSGLGAFPGTDVLTVDGVTFRTGVYPEFFFLTYLPEPGATTLLAVGGALLLALRAQRCW